MANPLGADQPSAFIPIEYHTEQLARQADHLERVGNTMEEGINRFEACQEKMTRVFDELDYSSSRCQRLERMVHVLEGTGVVGAITMIAIGAIIMATCPEAAAVCLAVGIGMLLVVGGMRLYDHVFPNKSKAATPLPIEEGRPATPLPPPVAVGIPAATVTTDTEIVN